MEGVDIVASLMSISATTAPKSKGENFVQTKMIQFGKKTKKKD
jgi:uncharacterized ferredoxin-like protein